MVENLGNTGNYKIENKRLLIILLPRGTTAFKCLECCFCVPFLLFHVYLYTYVYFKRKFGLFIYSLLYVAFCH